MRRISGILAALLLSCSPAAAATIYVEDFEAPFPAWESGWLGVNSNLENYYGIGQGRGNNPDGLWVSDGDGTHIDPLVDIKFDPAFGATLTDFAIDIAGFVPGSFTVYDLSGNALLVAPIPQTNGGMSEPGVYGHFSLSSSTGIGGFSFSPSQSQIEGNTSIDNVRVVSGTRTAPEPLSSALFALAGLALGLRYRS